MPHVPRLPPAQRFFARVDRFECECPSCGRLIESAREAPSTGKRLRTISRRRQRAAATPLVPSIRRLRWNPALQRLCCPHCTRVFQVGLLLYPVTSSDRGRLLAPSDVRMTPADRLRVRARGGGYLLHGSHRPGDPVNLYAEDGCRCPETGWSRVCPVHGDPGDPGGER